MRDSEHDTVVHSLCGDAQLRRVSAVQEWRVERELGSDRLVLSITTAPGCVSSFLVDSLDALDMAEVLNRRTQPLQPALPSSPVEC